MQAFQDDIKRSILSNISVIFPNADKRLAIWAETEKYRWKEDESVWNQKRGNTAPQYEAHFDGEFICFIDSSLGVSSNLVEFLTNLKKLFSERKIFIHEEMYAVEAAKKAEANKQEDLVIPKSTSEADEVIVKVIKKHAKKRGRKVVQK